MTHHQKSYEDVSCICCGGRDWKELVHSDWFHPRAWRNTWICGTCGQGLVHLEITTVKKEMNNKYIKIEAPKEWEVKR